MLELSWFLGPIIISYYYLVTISEHLLGAALGETLPVECLLAA